MRARGRSTFVTTFLYVKICIFVLVQNCFLDLAFVTSALRPPASLHKLAKSPTHVFIFGLGYTGLALVASIKEKFPDCLVSGTCRSVDKATNLLGLGIQSFIFDPDSNGEGLNDEAKKTLLEASHIVTMIPPTSDFDKDPVLDLHREDILRNIYSNAAPSNDRSDSYEKYNGINDDIYEDDINGYSDRVEQNRLDDATKDAGLWIGYVSTTGVYGDHSGDWVTEQSETLAPPSSKAFHRITAENDWLALRTQSRGDNGITRRIYPHVFRLGGIYGPGRSAIDTVKRKNSQMGADKAVTDSAGTNWVSRIHVADICGAILASMVCPVASIGGEGAIYNVADNVPAPRDEVMEYATNILLAADARKNQKNPQNSSMTVVEADSSEGSERGLQNGLFRVPSESSQRQEAVSGNSVAEKLSSERARRRMTENKRVNNGHLVKSLGYVFKYPTYKEGLTALALGSNDPFE